MAQTLLSASFGERSLVRNLAAVIGGSLVIALSAQVSVPMLPVPMTLQTLAIVLVGLTIGARLGVAAVATYLLEGAVGLPVFAGGMGGAVLFAGPTGGFLFGFLAIALIAGLAADRGLTRSFPTALAVSALALASVHVPGVLWLYASTPLSLEGAFAAGTMPFLFGDAVKAVIAALAVTGGWAALSARRG